MAEEKKTYYVIDPEGKITCKKCGVPLVKADAVFGYLDNAFPVELPVCPICGFVYVGNTPPELCPVCKVPSRKLEKIGG